MNYQRPHEDIARWIDLKPLPLVSVSSKSRFIIYGDRTGFPSIEELAEPELPLAGLRINPKLNSLSRESYLKKIKIAHLSNPQLIEDIEIPENADIQRLRLSPDGMLASFLMKENDGHSLWLADLKNKTTKRLTSAIINTILTDEFVSWTVDSKGLIIRTIVEGRGDAPKENNRPSGPIIQETTTDQKAGIRTYQDLLKSPHDEALFDYYCTSELQYVDLYGNITKLDMPKGIIRYAILSPDGKYLMVCYTRKPYSYTVPSGRFGFDIEIFDWKSGEKVFSHFTPSTENMPDTFGTVPTGKRHFNWRLDKPSTLYWMEAQDDGDMSKEVEIREILYTLDAPFNGVPQKLIQLPLRFESIVWGDGDLAIVGSWRWKDRRIVTQRFSPDNPDLEPITMFDYTWEDVYNLPGHFQIEKNIYNRSALMRRGDWLFMVCEGHSPDGKRPFLKKYNYKTLEEQVIWQCENGFYQNLDIYFPDTNEIVFSSESPEEPSNLFLLKDGVVEALTKFEHPMPEFAKVHREVIHYTRKDGVKLFGTLYLPPNFKKGEDQPLPALLWAYPKEYKNAQNAGQFDDTHYRFKRPYSHSPLYWVMRGFAVLDDPALPIIGEGDTEPNETYLEQLIAGAEAAIEYIVSNGIAKKESIAVGGHSYGAFMTANLLTHTDLFACGIARSGAYNRTLTPFGFQSEDRTYWQAPETYHTMSPFRFADKMKTPLLLIHGAADNNSGTLTLQTERYFAALKGVGAPARMVLLPHESHGYQGYESILHTLWEMDEWLHKYLVFNS